MKEKALTTSSKEIKRVVYQYDKKELDIRFSDVFFVIEANSFERQYLYRENEYNVRDYIYGKEDKNDIQHKPPRFKYEQDSSSFSLVLGRLNKIEVFVHFTFFKFDDLLVMCYEPTSQITDWVIVEEWLDVHCNPTYKGSRNRCDMNNVHQLYNAIEHKNVRKKKIEKILTE